MPITVRKDITVTELRKGDTFEETPPAVIESLTRKATWGAVQIAGEANPRRLRLDASVTVLREEPTEAEQARSRRTFMVQMLTDELTGWLRRDPARMLREIVDNDPGYGEVLTWSNLPDVLKAQAMFKHARTLWHHLGEPADLAAVDEDTLLEAFASWWHTNVHRLGDQGPRHDPISRSTSIISNIIDDCDDWAIQQIRTRIGWAGAREEMQRRVTQALAARQ
jgi:hypothetical protein